MEQIEAEQAAEAGRRASTRSSPAEGEEPAQAGGDAGAASESE